MKTIWKIPLRVTSHQRIGLPKGHKFLQLALQRNKPCLWFLVDPDNEMATYDIFIFGTGEPVPNDSDCEIYLGSFLMLDGKFVGHVFSNINFPANLCKA